MLPGCGTDKAHGGARVYPVDGCKKLPAPAGNGSL